MSIIITSVLIVIFLVELWLIRFITIYGGSYSKKIYISGNEVDKALSILENSNVGSHLSVSLSRGSTRVYFVKNQDERFWWIELLVPNLYSKNLKEIITHRNLDYEILESNLENCELNKNNYFRYRMADLEAAKGILSDYFKDVYQAQLSEEVFVDFNKLHVKKEFQVL